MAKSQNKKLKGIGGWLYAYLIFLFIFLVIGVIGIFGFIIGIIEGSESILMFILYLIYIFLMGYTFKSLVKKSPNAPKTVIFYVWFGVFFTLIDSITIAFSEGFISLIGSVVGATVITLYFLKSKRVENTFVK